MGEFVELRLNYFPMNIDAPEISLVIPCYNEEGNLRELVKAILAAVEPLQIPAGRLNIYAGPQ